MKIDRSIILIAIVIALSACGGAQNTNKAPTAPNTPVASPSPEKVAGQAQSVTIDSPDGVKLVGSYYEAGKPQTPALLLLHQWQSDRHSFDDFAKKMQGGGINVLAIDGRGFGDSTKKADGSTCAAGRTDADVKAMLGDVDAAFNFLGKQNNVDAKRIGIVGASYGSSLAIIYAADHPDVAAVALLSPGLNYFGNMQTEPAIKKYGTRPIFLTAAEDDKESADSVRKLAADDSKADQKIYSSGGHGTALFKVGLADELEKFLSATFSK